MRSRRHVPQLVALLLACGITASAAGAVRSGGAAAPDAGQILAALARQVPGIASATATPSKGGTPGTELEIRVAARKDTPVTTVMWKATIVAAAANGQYLAAGLSPVRGVLVFRVFPDGKEEPLGGGLGKGDFAEVFADVTPELLSGIEERCLALGLTNVSATVVRGLQDAIVVVARTSDEKATGDRLRSVGDTLYWLVGQAPSAFEGVYFEIDDTSGAAVYARAVATRAAAGFSGPDRFGIDVHSMPTSSRTPGSTARRASVKSLAGAVTFTRGPGQPSTKLKRWSLFHEGYGFTTGSDGSVTFALDHSVNPAYGHDTLAVSPATAFRVFAFRRDGNVAKAELRLTRGTLRVTVTRGKIPGEARVVKTGTGYATVSNGIAVVSAARGVTSVYAVRGRVQAAGNADARPIIVQQGYVTSVGASRKATVPRRYTDLPKAS